MELCLSCTTISNINGIVQERHNSIANTLELCLSCTNISNINGIVQERHNSIANALELRLPCTNILTYTGLALEGLLCCLPLLHVCPNPSPVTSCIYIHEGWEPVYHSQTWTAVPWTSTSWPFHMLWCCPICCGDFCGSGQNGHITIFQFLITSFKNKRYD